MKDLIIILILNLKKIGDIHGHGDVRSNFFEGSVTSYNQSSSVDGWDEI